MKQVHVECKPDELFLSKLGFSKKSIVHHTGKSRVFHFLKKNKNQLAIVDEDPGSIKSSYERNLKFKEESHGIRYFVDQSGNKIFILTGKLEDWILEVCKKNKVKPSDFNLPDKPNELHEVINNRLNNFGRLIDLLLENECSSILQLKSWLN